MTTPKTEGGLGLNKLEDWNKASLAKHLWKICLHNPTSNWAICARANLLRGRSIWEIQVPTNCSWIWRKLLKLRSLFRPYIRYIVGNGQLTWLWFDFWLPMGPIIPTLGERVIYDSGLQRQTKVTPIIHEGGWRWPLANSSELLTLKEAIPQGMVPILDTEDTVTWALSSTGKYTMGSAWNAIRRTAPVARWSNLIWFHGNIPRASFIVWLAFKSKLSTRDKYHSPQVGDSCVLCCSAQESHRHLLFECPMSAQIWQNILRKAKVHVPHLSWDILIDWLASNWVGASLSLSLSKLCLTATVYYVWQERNTRIHENRSRNVDCITHTILETICMSLFSYKMVEENDLNKKLQEDWALPDSIFAM